jgi:hypothetical protein
MVFSKIFAVIGGKKSKLLQVFSFIINEFFLEILNSEKNYLFKSGKGK